jgi:hypothetical protein
LKEEGIRKQKEKAMELKKVEAEKEMKKEFWRIGDTGI